MRFTAKRIENDIEKVNTSTFMDICRRVKSAFTRVRKITLLALIYTIFERKGRTLSIEIRNFEKVGLIEEKLTKTAYLKQRKNLKPEALMDLFKFHNKGLYDDNEMKEYKGYLLLSADGSNVNVPTTPETIETYGTSSRKGTKPQASLGLSCLYDCINKTSSIGILKESLILALLAESFEQREILFAQMIFDAQSEILPVRPNRSYKRTKGVLAGKFSNSRKRSY